MRIVHIIFGLKTGGAESMLVDIVNEQARFHSVMVLLVNASYDQSVLNGINVNVLLKRVGRPEGSSNPIYLAKLYLALLTFKPDILHAHNASLINMLIPVQVPKVLTVHGMYVNLPSKYQKYDAIFSITEAVGDDLHKRYPQVNSTRIYNGIRFNEITNKKSFNHRPFRVVQVGRFEHRIKGQDILLRAIKHVLDKIGTEEIIVDFIGEDVGSLNYLQKLQSELGISSYCHFSGPVARQEVYKNLHNYDLLVQPSRQEGFGLTIVEAMAAKVPVLISDLNGPMEIIGNGKYGYYFQSESDVDCAAKIIDIIHNARNESISNLLNLAYEYARENFDVHLTAHNYLNEYLKILSKEDSQSLHVNTNEMTK